MQSNYYIQQLKNHFGENLESLSPGDRYGLICLLSAAINRQCYPFQIYAHYQDFFEKIISIESIGYRFIKECPILSIPNVIKFLSETIPEQW